MPEFLPALCPRCGSSVAALGICPLCAGRAALDSWDLPATDEPPDETTGLTLGEYELLNELGRGAMGAVYRARHQRLGREVALKVILAGQFAGRAERRRFLVEAEAAARLDHPNLVALYEQGEDGGRLFQAMQLIDGPTLAQRLQGGPLPARDAAVLLAKCARAVQHAHERGVLHRDLKPGNVLLGAADEPHVADFGLARQMGLESSLTVAGSPVGTPSYMAPEVSGGAASTAAADVWSLGAILYELLSGHPPFSGPSVAEVLVALREREPEALRGHGTNVDRDLESICLRCLEKDPARRYPTALALAEDLERWLRGEPVQAQPITASERLVKWARRRPAIAALSGLAALLFIGGTAGIAWQWRRAVNHAMNEAYTRGLAEARELETRRALYAADMNLCLAALRVNNLGHARRLLDAHRPAPGALDLRGWEWRYLWTLCRSAAVQSLPHPAHALNGVAFSPDGREALTVASDGRFRFWDLEKTGTFRETRATGPGGPLIASPDGRLVLSPGATTRTCELHSFDGTPVRPLEVKALLRDAAFSADGALLVTHEQDGGVHLVRTSDGARVWDVQGKPMNSGFGGGVAFVPGQPARLLVGANDVLQVRRVEDGSLEREWPAHPGQGITAIAVAPDGRWAATGACLQDPVVRVWDPATGARLAVLSGHTSWISSLAVSADGQRLYSASADQTIRLWNTQDWTERAVFRGHTDEIWTLALAGERLISGAKNGEVLIWNARAGGAVTGRFDFAREVTKLDAAAGTGDVLATNNHPDGSFSRWTPGAWRETRMPNVRTPGRYSAQSQNGHFAGWDNGRATIETFATVPPSQIGDFATANFDAVQDREAGDWFALVRRAGAHTLYHAPTQRALELPPVPGGVRGTLLDESRPRFAVFGKDDTLRIYDTTAQQWQPPVLLNAPKTNFGFSFDLRWMFETHGTRVTIRRLEPRVETVLEIQQEVPEMSGCFSPDGRWLAVASQAGIARLWRLPESGPLPPPRELRGHLNAIHSVIFTKDSTRLVTLCSNTEAAKFWDVETGREVLTLTGRTTLLYFPFFIARGEVLAASSARGGERWHAWHAPSLEAIATAEKAGRW